MSVRGVKASLWVAIVIAIALTMAAVSPAFDRMRSFALFVSACAVFIVAMLWYRRVIPGAEAEQEREHAARVSMLKQEVRSTGQPVTVKSSISRLVFVLTALLSVAAGYKTYMTPDLKSIVVFVVLLGLTFCIGLLVLPFIGKPALTILPEGLATPDLGLFKWDEIESIGLREYTFKGVTSHDLCIYIPKLSERDRNVHPLLRFRRRMLRSTAPSVLAVPLRGGAYPAPVIHRLCYELWNEATGRTSIATVAPSKELIELKRRADEELQALERIGAMAQDNPDEAMKLLEEFKKRFPIREASPPKAASQKDWIETMLSEMSQVDRNDPLARQRVIDKHLKAEARRGMTTFVIVVVIAFAIVMGLFVLS